MSEYNGIEIELPIDQSEQARQSAAQNLLAQDVYKKIEEHLQSSLDKAPSVDGKEEDEFDDRRSHEAILIDGGRGTGKSSVLVNLKTYLKENKDFLILKPVDPTLLEHGDDLLLNVIVAALMRDKIVTKALQNNEKNAEAFYEQLHKLGSALESIQKQKEQFGLDKLRAFMGNQSLAEHVHILLKKTLLLTNRRLIVLPIDDVDTSLELAFENIEVVRKYLTSPYVVPLISGDLSLYDDVIWREFHGRLTNKSRIKAREARVQAQELAEEYQRKVLPLPRRIKLPVLSSYLGNPNITLYNKGERLFPLSTFNDWIDALLNERVNGEENSHLDSPIQTVREMTQLINATQALIPSLKKQLALDSVRVSATMLKRLIFMPVDIARAIQTFGEEMRKASSNGGKNKRQRTEIERINRSLRSDIAKIRIDQPTQSQFLSDWYKALANYFQYHRKGGPVFLTCDTNYKWRTSSDAMKTSSVLAHDLFQPLTHTQKKYENFEATTGVRQSWTDVFKGIVPSMWLEQLPEKTIVPYPTPEKGEQITTGKSGPWAFDRHVSASLKGKAEFVRQLLVHWSFYKPNQRSNLILHGRMFELLVTSLVRDISAAEIPLLINRPPFHSIAALAHTKALTLSDTPEPSTDDQKEEDASQETEAQSQLLDETIYELVEDINSWRREHHIAVPHCWLIYNVMNKVFNQLGFPSAPRKSGTTTLEDLLDSSIQAFHTIWAAFGSFEKGEAFGLPRIIANVNMSSSTKSFEKSVLYGQNISPFLQKTGGKLTDLKTGAYTFSLESHPLRKVLTSVKAGYKADIEEIRSPTAEDFLKAINLDRRLSAALDDVIKQTAARQKIKLSLTFLNTQDALQISKFVKEVEAQCTTNELMHKFKSTLTDENIPSRSGRWYLRRCIERLNGSEEDRTFSRASV